MTSLLIPFHSWAPGGQSVPYRGLVHQIGRAVGSCATKFATAISSGGGIRFFKRPYRPPPPPKTPGMHRYRPCVSHSQGGKDSPLGKSYFCEMGPRHFQKMAAVLDNQPKQPMLRVALTVTTKEGTYCVFNGSHCASQGQQNSPKKSVTSRDLMWRGTDPSRPPSMAPASFRSNLPPSCCFPNVPTHKTSLSHFSPAAFPILVPLLQPLNKLCPSYLLIGCQLWGSHFSFLRLGQITYLAVEKITTHSSNVRIIYQNHGSVGTFTQPSPF